MPFEQVLKAFAIILALGTASPALADEIDAQDGPEQPDAETAAILADEDATTENAVIESSDAFGTQVGRESTGLYSSREVRGFNPEDAGNVRIASLYFDQVNMMPQRLRQSSSIRVGIGTMGFAFPAPTGLVDYTLRSPGTERSLTIDASGRSDGNEGIAAEIRLPDLGVEGFGLYGAYAYRHLTRNEGGSRGRFTNTTAMVEIRPGGGVQLNAFISRDQNRDTEVGPTYFLAGDALPPKENRRRDLSQEWADTDENAYLMGGVLTVPLGEFGIEAGLFYNTKERYSTFADLMTGVDAEGNVAERIIIADSGSNDTSLSGELRVSREFSLGNSQHRLSLSVRGRERSRLFGGSDRVSLGPSTIMAADPRERPEFDIGPKNNDDVRQYFVGAAYTAQLTDWLRVDFGASKIDYSKQVDYAAPDTPDVETATAPIAWNTSLAFALSPKLTLFGSVARGMEEADIAPDRAINRAEAPAAINTRQEEVVLSYTPVAEVTVLAGLFRISKPYYNLDPDLRYHLLGTVVNQGVEISAVARPVDGLTLLGGAVISDPKIEGEIVDSGTIDSRPTGQPGLRIVANIDWRFDRGESPFSIDAGVEMTGTQAVNTSNTFEVPPVRRLDLGTRYRFEVADARVVLRSRLENVTNTYGWFATGSGRVGYGPPRTVWLELLTVI